MNRYNQTYSGSRTLTTLIETSKKQGRKILYLVLKQKPLSKETVENLTEEIEKRLGAFFIKIAPKLEQMKPNEPETFLKYLLLQGVLKILENIMKKSYLSLTEEDKKAVERIYKKCEEEDFEKEENDG
jgi:hypothetical protein